MDVSTNPTQDGPSLGHSVYGQGPEKVLVFHDWMGDSGNYEPLLPTVSSASVAERQARQLLLDLLPLGSIAGSCQAVGKLEETITLGVLGLEAGFDQLRDDSAGARPLDADKGSNPAGHTRGESHALPQRLR